MGYYMGERRERPPETQDALKVTRQDRVTRRLGGH